MTEPASEPRLFERQLDIYLRARFTLILLVTSEEERAIQSIKSVCERSQRSCIAWDLAEGFTEVLNDGQRPGTARDAVTALEQIDKTDTNTVYVLKDFHEAWNNPQVKRKLKNVAQRCKFNRKSLIVTSSSSKLPDELRDEVVVIEFLPPTAPELDDVLNRIIQTPGLKIKVNLTSLGREKLTQAALGLTAAQAQRVFAKAIVSDGFLDDRAISLVTEEKKQIIRESEALEFYPASETPDDVGGLGVLKSWLRLREQAFTQRARDYGLPSPKGIALIGIPGTGKSLTAKMIGGLWRLPLLRLDVGSLFGSLVGESEERARRALRLAETVAPCIIWIDEMEKALSHGGLDSGTSTRVFGTILTWMQEKTAPCFVVATANDISSLPPELLRKGRFDEIFFLDLPNRAERAEIFAVHLRKRRRLQQDYDLARLAEASEGYVGAEIEQAIIDAMYVGFNAGREFTTQDIADALQKQVPLSVSQRETIEHLRSWLHEGRALSASQSDAGEEPQPFLNIQLNP
ncbi:MAG TPA: AAA family ATPase [Anaerolineaceae bacterium]|nr:AAA family ATPase [Anaerolineaceae bacterium]HPN50889.1 AAA family ATPase [Anaerolineaceae bacterium]